MALSRLARLLRRELGMASTGFLAGFLLVLQPLLSFGQMRWGLPIPPDSGVLRRRPAHRRDPLLRSFLPSVQIQRARPPAANHDPAQRLGFGTTRRRRGSDVAPVTQIQHAFAARAPGRHGREDFFLPCPDDAEEEHREARQRLIHTVPYIDWFDIKGNEVFVAQDGPGLMVRTLEDLEGILEMLDLHPPSLEVRSSRGWRAIRNEKTTSMSKHGNDHTEEWTEELHAHDLAPVVETGGPCATMHTEEIQGGVGCAAAARLLHVCRLPGEDANSLLHHHQV